MISIQTRAQLAKTVLGTMALGNGTVLTAVTAVVNQSTAFSYMVAGKMKTKAVNVPSPSTPRRPWPPSSPTGPRSRQTRRLLG